MNQKISLTSISNIDNKIVCLISTKKNCYMYSMIKIWKTNSEKYSKQAVYYSFAMSHKT